MSNERHGESDGTPTESKTTGTVGNFPHGSRETPGTSVFIHGSGSVGEGARPQFRHVRFRGVRQLHSTAEAGEQRQRSAVGGVCGGKGVDQGERRAVATGPDTAPGLQVVRTVGRTSSGTSPKCGLVVIIQGKSRMR